MNTDYMDLRQLQQSRGYQKLQALWAKQYAIVVEGMRKSAKKNQESAWRFYAGQMEGFDLAISQLDRALLQMEKEGESETPASATVEELMKEIRGEKS
jgi:hypothetical protein